MRVFRLINGSPTEGSLSQLIPNCTNPELLTPAELTAAGILTLPDPAPAAEGKRWDPSGPTLVKGVLTGGWVLVDLPVVIPEPNWVGFLSQFVFPGNEVYTQIATPVQESNNPVTQEHWENLRNLLLSPEFRTRDSVIAGWDYLKFLLGDLLSKQAAKAFEDLARANQIIL